MNFDWNPNAIRWYQEANEYTGFFKNVAKVIEPKLEGHSTLCDIGCGLGLVDLELSKSIDNITCIDINKKAIEALKKSVEIAGVTNIEPQLMNCDDMEKNYDVILISFFGSRNLERFLPYCKKIVAIVGGKSQTELFPEKYRTFHKNQSSNVEQMLIEKGLKFTATECLFEFGQPLLSIEDARSFVRSLSDDILEKDLEFFIAERLVETQEERYPYFIPRMKSVTIFEIEGRL